MSYTETERPGAGAHEERGEDGPGRFRRGFLRGVGALSALREALGETVQEARERGDFSVDRARYVMKEAAGRAREATNEARDRFDFVTRGDFDALAKRVEVLELRLRASDGPGDPEDPPGGER